MENRPIEISVPVRLLISLLFLGLLIIDLFFPKYDVSIVTVILAVLVLLPFILPYLDELQVGSLRLRFKRSLKKLNRQADQALVTSGKSTKEAQNTLEQLMRTINDALTKDPNLAAGVVRLHLEQLLNELALKANPKSFVHGEQPTIAKYIQVLQDKNMIDSEQSATIESFYILLSQAMNIGLDADTTFLLTELAGKVFDMLVEMNTKLSRGTRKK